VIERVGPAAGSARAALGETPQQPPSRAVAIVPVAEFAATLIEPPRPDGSAGFLAHLLGQEEGAPRGPALRPREAAARYAATARAPRRIGWLDV
jgi:hypothetical protein